MSSVSAFFDKVFNALGSFNFFSDLLDILLVTIIIYEGIKLIRGSRSLQLIKGIVLLAASFALVKLFNMEASSFMLTKLFENALIILVVLFSPEIRNILESFGRQSFHNISLFNFRGDSESEKRITDTVNDFCKAAGDMSETKTGALVVFEKAAPLREIIESGTLLDACSSAELFNGLFFKNSALHDGAVIVRDGRIHAAGCILPLTHNPDISSELGTRHRAAIGVTEDSDAVAVVVSEETGYISVIQNGKITRDVSTGKLRELLLASLIPQDDESKKKSIFKRKKKNAENSAGGDDNGEK